MEQLSVQAFLPILAPYAAKDQLLPADASRLALTITELLLDHLVDLQLLKFLSRFLTQDAYDDIIEERNIEHQCGYVTCRSLPRQMARRLSAVAEPVATKYQIYNRKPLMILPNTYLSQYCCKEHYQALVFFRNQLSQEAVFARKDIVLVAPFTPGFGYENTITCLEEVLAKHRELRDQGKTLTDVIAMMNGLSVSEDQRDTTELIRLIEDFDIVEKEGGLVGDFPPEENDPEVASRGIDDYITSSKCFGGYVV